MTTVETDNNDFLALTRNDHKFPETEYCEVILEVLEHYKITKAIDRKYNETQVSGHTPTFEYLWYQGDNGTYRILPDTIKSCLEHNRD